jgi:hypothetical protein
MKKQPDKQRAESIIKSSLNDIKFILKITPKEESASIIVRNIYESFRMLGESILIKKGIKKINHINSINELIKLNLNTKKPLNLLENLMRLRNNINYNGYRANLFEAKDTILLAKTCYLPLLNKVKKILEK